MKEGIAEVEGRKEYEAVWYEEEEYTGSKEVEDTPCVVCKMVVCFSS